MSENFNTDELEPPLWMDSTFLERALRSYVNDSDLTVKSFESKPATKVGDHFSSIMFRINITYDSPKYKKLDEKLQVIVKAMPWKEGTKTDFFKDSPAFKIETRMYSEVLPAMHRLLEDAGDETVLSPKLIYHTFDPVPTLVLEDLTVSGFEMPERTLDFDDAKEVAIRIAKFHAASIHLQANDLDLTSFNETRSKLPESDETALDKYMVPTFDLLIEAIHEWEGDWSGLVEKLEKCKWGFAKKAHDVYIRKDPGMVSVLNHCDFHFKNLMFRKEGGRIQDLLLLDFQWCFWGTCAIDLCYLFYVICNTDARERRTEILQLYQAELESTLKKLGYLGRIPSLHDLNVEILRNRAMEVLLCVSIMLFQFMDFSNMNTDETYDINNTFDVYRKAMRNPEYQRAMKIELPRLVSLGLIG